MTRQMPGTFVAAIIFAVIALGFAIAIRPARKAEAAARALGKDDTVPAALVTFVTGVFAVLTLTLTLASAWNPVPTQDIGIETSFGQPIGHLGDGLNWTAPWDQVANMDEAIQVTDSTFLVRIAGGQTAQATVKLRWQVGESASDDVFKNYHNSTSGVEAGLLTPELNAATNATLDGYDPLTPLATGAVAGSPTNPSTTQLAAQIQKALTARVAPDVRIITLVLLPLEYDATVQQRINSVTNQVAKTDVAKQSELTAEAQATANNDVAASVAQNPLVLVQQCMNAIADGAFTPPAGFSCWPGAGSGVVIPAGK